MAGIICNEEIRGGYSNSRNQLKKGYLLILDLKKRKKLLPLVFQV